MDSDKGIGCRECNGLTYRQINGRTQVMVPENFGFEAPGALQAAMAQGKAFLERDAGISPARQGEATGPIARPASTVPIIPGRETGERRESVSYMPAIESPSPTGLPSGRMLTSAEVFGHVLPSGLPPGGGTPNFTLYETDALDVHPDPYMTLNAALQQFSHPEGLLYPSPPSPRKNLKYEDLKPLVSDRREVDLPLDQKCGEWSDLRRYRFVDRYDGPSISDSASYGIGADRSPDRIYNQLGLADHATLSDAEKWERIAKVIGQMSIAQPAAVLEAQWKRSVRDGRTQLPNEYLLKLAEAAGCGAVRTFEGRHGMVCEPLCPLECKVLAAAVTDVKLQYLRSDVTLSWSADFPRLPEPGEVMGPAAQWTLKIEWVHYFDLVFVIDSIFLLECPQVY